MQFPFLPGKALSCHKISAFAGLDRTESASLPGFSHMENLSGEHYPAASPRQPRTRVLSGQVQGLSTDNGLCYVAGGSFYIAGNPVLTGLSEGEKQLISMGAKVIILPDKKWLNTVDLSTGNLEATVEAVNVSFSLVDGEGKPYEVRFSEAAPENPQKGALWLTETDLLQFDGEDFLPLPTFVRMGLPGAGFKANDVVEISGIAVAGMAALNGSHRLIRAEETYIDIEGFCLPATQPEALGLITVSRKMPAMDMVFECGNRLWGCRYGVDNGGQIVNEIYASRLGDATNWSDFSGTAADSWRVSLGSQGAFTGGLSYLGQPLFFKEGSLHRVYGSYPAQFGLDSVDCRGVAKGSEKSLAVVDEILYYLSPAGVCRYDGSLPVLVSQKLGDWHLEKGVAGSFRGQYYLSCQTGEDKHLLVYAPRSGLFHRHEALDVKSFAGDSSRLYCRCGDGIWVLGEGQETVVWSAVTPPLTLEGFHATAFGRLSFLLRLPVGSRMEIRASYDEKDPVLLGVLEGSEDVLRKVVFRPKRCQQFRLYFSGQGDMAIKELGIYTREGGKIA